MFKALLIAVATFVSFDAVAWRGVMRHELIREARVSIGELASLDWSWG